MWETYDLVMMVDLMLICIFVHWVYHISWKWLGGHGHNGHQCRHRCLHFLDEAPMILTALEVYHETQYPLSHPNLARKMI